MSGAPAGEITTGPLSPSDRPAWAAERGCGRVYWHTHETNATARLLYDKVAARPGFIMYAMDLG